MANITNNTIDSSSSFETSSTSMGTTTTSNVPFLYEVMTKNNQPFVKIKQIFHQRLILAVCAPLSMSYIPGYN